MRICIFIVFLCVFPLSAFANSAGPEGYTAKPVGVRSITFSSVLGFGFEDFQLLGLEDIIDPIDAQNVHQFLGNLIDGRSLCCLTIGYYDPELHHAYGSCQIERARDLAAEMVKAGMAIPTSGAYHQEFIDAQKSMRGLWTSNPQEFLSHK